MGTPTTPPPTSTVGPGTYRLPKDILNDILVGINSRRPDEIEMAKAVYEATSTMGYYIAGELNARKPGGSGSASVEASDLLELESSQKKTVKLLDTIKNSGHFAHDESDKAQYREALTIAPQTGASDRAGWVFRRGALKFRGGIEQAIRNAYDSGDRTRYPSPNLTDYDWKDRVRLENQFAAAVSTIAETTQNPALRKMMDGLASNAGASAQGIDVATNRDTLTRNMVKQRGVEPGNINLEIARTQIIDMIPETDLVNYKNQQPQQSSITPMAPQAIVPPITGLTQGRGTEEDNNVLARNVASKIISDATKAPPPKVKMLEVTGDYQASVDGLDKGYIIQQAPYAVVVDKCTVNENGEFVRPDGTISNDMRGVVVNKWEFADNDSTIVDQQLAIQQQMKKFYEDRGIRRAADNSKLEKALSKEINQMFSVDIAIRDSVANDQVARDRVRQRMITPFRGLQPMALKAAKRNNPPSAAKKEAYARAVVESTTVAIQDVEDRMNAYRDRYSELNDVYGNAEHNYSLAEAAFAGVRGGPKNRCISSSPNRCAACRTGT